MLSPAPGGDAKIAVDCSLPRSRRGMIQARATITATHIHGR
jgi:hypothetical protein